VIFFESWTLYIAYIVLYCVNILWSSHKTHNSKFHLLIILKTSQDDFDHNQGFTLNTMGTVKGNIWSMLIKITPYYSMLFKITPYYLMLFKITPYYSMIFIITQYYSMLFIINSKDTIICFKLNSCGWSNFDAISLSPFFLFFCSNRFKKNKNKHVIRHKRCKGTNLGPEQLVLFCQKLLIELS